MTCAAKPLVSHGEMILPISLGFCFADGRNETTRGLRAKVARKRTQAFEIIRARKLAGGRPLSPSREGGAWNLLRVSPRPVELADKREATRLSLLQRGARRLLVVPGRLRHMPSHRGGSGEARRSPPRCVSENGALPTGPRKLVGLGRMHEDFAIRELRMAAHMIDVRVRRGHESRPRGQAIDNRPQRRDPHPAVNQNVALPAQDQERVRAHPPVAARLRDPEEVRRELRHLKPGFLNRKVRVCRFVSISGALGHAFPGTSETLKPQQTRALLESRLVRTAGVEPAQPCGRGILSPLRLPVSPRPHGQRACFTLRRENEPPRRSAPRVRPR